MLPCKYNNEWFIFDFGAWFFDGDDIQTISSDGLSNGVLLHHFLLVLYLELLVKIVVQIAIRVGVGLRYPQDIVLMRGRTGKTQSIVITSAVFDSVLVFVVFDLSTAPHPSAFVSLPIFKREEAGQHAVVEKRVRLPKVDDVDLDRGLFGRIIYPEIKPLGVSLGIHVVLKN